MSNTIKGGIQLPDDVVALDYKETRPFHFEQVFYSPLHDFKGTEREFIKAGLAYKFYESDYKRFVAAHD